MRHVRLLRLLLLCLCGVHQRVLAQCSIEAGAAHTIALVDGAAFSFGRNTYGALGVNRSANELFISKVPLAVVGLGEGVRAACAGEAHSCVLTVGGAVHCFGEQRSGVLGDGFNAGSHTTMPGAPAINLGSGIVDLACKGRFTCARRGADEALLCWGVNTDLQTGVLNAGVAVTTATGAALLGVSAMAVSAYTTYAIQFGNVYYWGRVHLPGMMNSATPIEIAGIGSPWTVSAGRSHACVLTWKHRVKCFGHDSTALGIARYPANATATPAEYFNDRINSASQVIDVVCGGTVSCVRLNSSQLECIGSNSDGLLANSKLSLVAVPVVLSSLGGAVLHASIHDNHACALLSNGSYTCWGKDLSGALGRADAQGSAHKELPLPVDNIVCKNPAATAAAVSSSSTPPRREIRP